MADELPIPGFSNSISVQGNPVEIVITLYFAEFEEGKMVN